eukprot:854760-Amphidinium_carterae.1
MRNLDPGDTVANASCRRMSSIAHRLYESILKVLSLQPLKVVNFFGDPYRQEESGGYTLLASPRRGAAANGFGTPLSNLADGEKDADSLRANYG